MIDRVRYFFGVGSVIFLPAGLLFWLVIHPWVRWWRRWGPLRTYFVVFPAMTAVGALLFRFREPLLGTNLGTNWGLVAVAAVMYAGVTWLEFQYWRHLSFATLVGIPELSPRGQQQGRLMQEGIYGVVRHPRYLSAGVSVIANALFINYAGLYLVVLLLVPVGYLMIVLEERELIERFGEEYRTYQRGVPRLIPRWRKTH